ncbi:MAG: DUF29 domain-containing protein [Rhodospirillaceae bacterium]
MGLHDQDFYAWANEQAALLRARNMDAADIDNIAEEIASMGRSEKRELISRLAVLLLHLLKWQLQPERQCKSWRLSVEEQRRKLQRHLADNPSLNSKLEEVIGAAYGDAVLDAKRETDLEEGVFLDSCPWVFDQIMDASFWPEG